MPLSDVYQRGGGSLPSPAAAAFVYSFELFEVLQ